MDDACSSSIINFQEQKLIKAILEFTLWENKQSFRHVRHDQERFRCHLHLQNTMPTSRKRESLLDNAPGLL